MKWLPIKDFEDSYLINRKGEVKSLFTNKILKHLPTTKGYVKVHLYNDGIMYNMEVHRLVGLMFVKNPKNKPSLNHKDNNRKNPAASNLEWATNKENIQYCAKQGRLKGGRAKIKILKLKGLVILGRYNSLTEAANKNKLLQSKISSCLSGARKSHGGFQWASY